MRCEALRCLLPALSAPSNHAGVAWQRLLLDLSLPAAYPEAAI